MLWSSAGGRGGSSRLYLSHDPCNTAVVICATIDSNLRWLCSQDIPACHTPDRGCVGRHFGDISSSGSQDILNFTYTKAASWCSPVLVFNMQIGSDLASWWIPTTRDSPAAGAAWLVIATSNYDLVVSAMRHEGGF